VHQGERQSGKVCPPGLFEPTLTVSRAAVPQTAKAFIDVMASLQSLRIGGTPARRRWPALRQVEKVRPSQPSRRVPPRDRRTCGPARYRR